MPVDTFSLITDSMPLPSMMSTNESILPSEPVPSSPPLLKLSKLKFHPLNVRQLMPTESSEPSREKFVTPSRSTPFHQEITSSGIQMIETMVDLRTNTSSRTSRTRKGTDDSFAFGNGDRDKIQIQAMNSARRASDTNAITMIGSQKQDSTPHPFQKRHRSGSLMDVKGLDSNHESYEEDDQEHTLKQTGKLSLEERVHEHALAAAAVAKSFPSNGKHSTTFEMIESMEGDNKPDKIVRVHVIADRFSACIPCRRRKIRCLPSDEMPRPKTGTCGTCLRRGKTCVWTDDSHGKSPDKNKGKKQSFDDVKEFDKQHKLSKRKRSSVKQEQEEYHLQTYSKVHGMKNKQYDYPDTAHLLDPPKFENVNWAGMQYPPFYNASEVNPFLSPTTNIPQSTLLALEKHGYPHGGNALLSANYSGSPNSTLHSPSTPSTWATAPVLKSEPLGGQTAHDNQSIAHHYQYQDQSHFAVHNFERSYSASSGQVPTIVTGLMKEHSSSNGVTANTTPDSMPSSYFSPTLDTPNRPSTSYMSLQGQNVPPFAMPGMARSHSFHCVSGMGQKDFPEEALSDHAMMMREISFDFKGYSQDSNTPYDSESANANFFMKDAGQEHGVCDPTSDRHYISSFLPPSPHHLAISTSVAHLPSCSSSLPSPSIPNGSDSQIIGGSEYSHPTNEVNGLIPSDKTNMFPRTMDWTNPDMLHY
ncbi:uncharacterized protein FA14DRAFT_184544 [Meira miltonrushii]|uniref:Zn(2)-C6 fungal-type domain-containing protein n=1 Tax=Meira miltonrushii TaxID=1280837 RepID=A0A316VCC8_9BASI|nr:uncharacterized protein FA14DRAFT_184544 [Meira miltonrushii]PWN35317.1 hypothetical protein FA14DRAFT_184544 [Meira miltonrushii]